MLLSSAETLLSAVFGLKPLSDNDEFKEASL